MDDIDLKPFLEISYSDLEEMNLSAKKKRVVRTSQKALRNYYLTYLKSEKQIKAVTIGFSDIEGRFHMLDYDKKYFLSSYDSLTFDGSSIRGFSRQAESDLRLDIDWSAFWWLPSDVFGPGKVLIMGQILDQNNKPYEMDNRSVLAHYLDILYKTKKYDVHVAPEIEGILIKGIDAEKNYREDPGFKLASMGGYFHSLPTDILRKFIDTCAEAQRAMGFENEKDHPEVAPAQFELNYLYTDALIAADQIQIYKLVCRQIARNMGMTASFLPKPIVGINGSGMHTNISINKNGNNLFYDKKGKAQLSRFAWDFIDRILTSAGDISLILNASVNAYRRLDPHFEAPNEIKVSAVDRGAMIRIPIHTEKSARVEVRSIGPDANPYIMIYTLLKTGLEAKIEPKNKNKRIRVKYLPVTIQNAITAFRQSAWTSKLLGEEYKKRYIALKSEAADRSPLALGKKVKKGEVIYHHEIYNQLLWNEF